MITEIIGTDVGNFKIEVFSRTKTLGSVFDIKIETPSGYVYKDSYSGDNPVEFAIAWISESGIDGEERFIDNFRDNQIWECGRDNDLPIAESVLCFRDFA